MCSRSGARRNATLAAARRPPLRCPPPPLYRPVQPLPRKHAYCYGADVRRPAQRLGGAAALRAAGAQIGPKVSKGAAPDPAPANGRKRQRQAALGAARWAASSATGRSGFAARNPQYRIGKTEDVDMYHLLLSVGSFRDRADREREPGRGDRPAGRSRAGAGAGMNAKVAALVANARARPAGVDAGGDRGAGNAVSRQPAIGTQYHGARARPTRTNRGIAWPGSSLTNSTCARINRKPSTT